jgi:DNA-directed RNA polymerase specialized sigma subunit
MANVAGSIDFPRLRRSNDLAWKWFSRADMHKNKYVKWIMELKKNPEQFKKSLPPSMRSAFAKDLKEMFYAAEIENDLITQYVPMIKHVLNKIVYRDIYRDELQSIGMIAIRNAIWQYRNVGIKASFKTYCFNSVFMRMTGEVSKIKTVSKRRNKKCTTTLYTDINKDVKFHDLAVAVHTHTDIETTEVFQKVLEDMKLKEDEKYLFNLLVNRSRTVRGQEIWYQPYLDNFKHCFPKGRLSKEAVRLRILKLQKTFWSHWHSVQGLEMPVMPKPKMGVAI